MFPISGKIVDIEIWNSPEAADGTWIKLAPIKEY
jgi:hypothetical protein